MSSENDAKCEVRLLNGKVVLMISGLEIGGTRIDLSPEVAEKLGWGLVKVAADAKEKPPTP